METDRWACLAVRAHCQGLLDYAAFDRRDPAHRLKEQVIFRELEKSAQRELLDLRHQEMCGLLAYAPEWDEKAKLHNHYSQQAMELYNQLGELALPWLSWSHLSSDKIKENEALQLKTRWEARFGKMDDPEVARKLAIYQKLTHKTPEQPPPGTEWLRVYR